ncbi:TENX protein, partial [Crocuta crocuta]
PRGGSPSSRLYEHTVEGGEKQVVFTHRINLPPSAGCGCPPGTEPPVPASEVQALKVRLEILEELVKGLKEQCTGSCCPAAAQAGTGCSQRGRCENGRCVCDHGYTGDDCGVRSCPRGCSQRGRCEDGRCVCDPGYTGDDCGSRSCPWDCGEGGRCVDGRCVCWPGYAGEDCSTRTCPRDCRGRGRCEDGECICDAGYSGDDCGVRSCPGDCHQRGRCEDGRCVCWPGYTGPDCGSRACPRDCRGRGRCENGVCVCNTGYSGEDCGVRSCPGDCRGRGRCESGRCVCWPGYTGRDCGTRACPGDCRGRGRCVDGRCVCNPGFAGEDCGSRRCPGDCRGRGRCEDGVCVCNAGYEGEDCGVRSCPGGCHGRGQCLDGRCVCDDGYSGEDCSVQRCPRDCNQHGLCQDGVCTCWEGYAGEDCGLRTCPSNCHQRGRCEDGRCVCDSGYTGPSCATRTCPADCRGRGRCVQGVCVCHVGYSGEDCGQEEPPASACPGGCGPRELCREGQCVCVEGFRGPDCAIQTCPGDCRGRGECREGSCVCQDGYAGEDCGEVIDGPQDLRVVAVTPTTMELSWLRPQAEVDRFVVSYVSAGNQRVRLEVPSEADGTLLTDLMPGVEYVVTVTAERGRAVSYPASVRANTVTPPRLGKLWVTDPTRDSLRLSWTVPEGQFDSFIVQYRDRNGQPQVVPVEGPERSVIVSSLDPDHKYRFTLFGIANKKRHGPLTADGTTEQPLLGELMVTHATPDSLRLSWTVTQGSFDSFMVQYKDAQGQSQAVPVRGDENKVTVSGLESHRKYKMNLYGLHGRQRVGPMSVVATTGESGPHRPPSTPAPNVTPNSVGLAWTVPEGQFDSFVVQYKDRDGQPQVVPVATDQREVTIPGLDPARKYKMNFYGLHGGQRVGPLSVVAVTATESPQEPRLGELTVTDLTSDSASLSWTVPEGEFDSFVVQYKDRDGQPRVVPVAADQREVTIPGLEPSRKYKFLLFGIQDGKRRSPVSVEAKTAKHSPKPHLGEELQVTRVNPDSVSLSWTVPEGQFDSFVVQYKDRDGQPQVVPVQGSLREVSIPGLDPARRYKLLLYGLHQGKRVGPISAIAVTGPEPRLGEVTVEEARPDTLHLSWSVMDGDFDSFEVQYTDEDGQFQVVKLDGDRNDIILTGLESDHRYLVTLYGLHGRQRVGPAHIEALTEPPIKPRLGQLAVTDATPDSLHLSWTVPEGQFDHFLVQYKNGDGQPKAVRVPGNEDQVTISGLEPDHKYKMNLYGFHGGQRVGPVSAFGVTGEWMPHLGELAVTDATPDSLHLSWTVPEGQFDHFLVQYKNGDGQPKVVRVPGNEDQVTISGLEPDHKYKMNLYGFHGGQRVGPVSTATETPEEPLLGELTVTGSSPDSLSLSWTVPQGHFDSFTVQYKDRDGRPQVVRVRGEESEVTVGGLEPGRKYKMHLYGLHKGQRWGPVSTVGATDTKPLRLGELTVTDLTSDSASLSWTVPEGEFDSFVVQYKDRDGQPRVVPVAADQREVTIPGLEPSRKYKFLLYGLAGRKRLGPISADGSTAPLKKEQQRPPRLGELTVTDETPDSLHLSWTVAQGLFDSFVVQYRDTAGQPQAVPAAQDQREVTIEGLEPGRKYKFLLYGIHGGQRLGPISILGVTVLESPRDLQFSEIGETSAQVSWTPPPSRVDSFKVSYQLADGGEPQSVQVDGRARTQKLKGLIPGSHYEVTVVSVRGFEESEPLTGFLTTVPDGPTQLRALNLTEGSALLHWKPPQAPVDTYDVRVTAPGAPPLQASASGSAVDYPLGGLVLHTNYTATVRGLRGPNFTSPASITFTTGLEAPRDLEAKEVTPRTALLTWTEPQVPPTSYLLSFNTPGGQTQEILLPGGVTSHQLLGLFPSTPYSVWLRAMWGESLTPPVSTSFTTGGLRIPFPRDCGEEMQNGASTSRATTIFLNGNRERPLDVFCDMETDGGGWLVFQRRMDGQTDFWRDWEDYAHGFGNISGEFWLGNEALHSLTKAGDYSMRVDLRAGDEAVFAQYDSFRVDSAADYYRLHLEGYHGTAGDSMSYHSGSVFSARDRDPNNLLISCAVSYRGAWWYRNCHYANLNGLYGSTVDHQGVSWYYWKGFEFSVPFTEMKLRPRSYRPPEVR